MPSPNAAANRQGKSGQLRLLQECDFEMHSVRSTGIMPAPEEAPTIRYRHQLASRPFLSDQGRPLSELVVPLVNVERATERVVAQGGTAATHDTGNKRAMVDQNAVEQLCCFPFRPHSLKLRRRKAVEAHCLRCPVAQGLSQLWDWNTDDVVPFPRSEDADGLRVVGLRCRNILIVAKNGFPLRIADERWETRDVGGSWSCCYPPQVLQSIPGRETRAW